MKKIWLKICSVLAAFIMITGNGIVANAAGDYQVLQVCASQEKIVAYMKGSTEIQEVVCQIGMTPCEGVEFSAFTDGSMTLHTIVLFDNSLSITDASKQKAQEVLKAYFESKNENEYVSLAVFGEDITFLAEHTNDAAQLCEALEGIVHNDQDTYLTDVMYDLMDTLDKEEYTRFVVVSDGVDNKSIGITKEELLDKLESNNHPIYSLGHIYKSNETQLENMFALSRMTNGSSFLLDDVDDASVIVDELVKVDDIVRVKADIPQDVKDGSDKSMLFTLTSAAGVSEVKAEVEMPFSIKEEPESIPETTVEETVTMVETTEETTTVEVTSVVEEATQVQQTEPEDSGMDLSTVLALIVLVAALVLLLLKNKKDKNKPEKKDKKKKEQTAAIQVPVAEEKTIIESTPYMPDPEATVMLERRYMLVLKDAHDASKIFKYPLDNKITLGRNVDKVNIAIDYNKTVSGMHCEIFVRNSHFYIRDLNSANKTYVNGQIVSTETEIRSGCIIALGEVELSVEVIPM